MVPIYLVKGTKFWKNLTECNFNILEVKMISREKWRTLHTENDKLEVNMAPSFPVPLSPVAYRRELGVQTPTSKFRGPSNIVAKSTRLWKLLNIAEFRKPTPQDVREKGSKILKLPSVRNSFTLAMTNKLAVIINGLKIPKIKKILLYEMKFLLPNYSCLHNPWLGGCRPQIPVLSVLKWFCWPPPTTEQNSWVRHCCRRTFVIYLFLRFAAASYGRFIAIRFGVNLSTYIQNRWR